MPEDKKFIELLPKLSFEELALSKKLATWVINIGRVIIIGTELLAFSVFVARIKLDRELTDLTETLETQQLILKNASDLEVNVRRVQQKLSSLKELRQRQRPAAKVITFFSGKLPPNVILTDLTLERPQEVTLSANTNSALDFARMVTRLKESPRVEEVAMTAGRFAAKNSAYHFTLAIQLSGDFFE